MFLICHGKYTLNTAPESLNNDNWKTFFRKYFMGVVRETKHAVIYFSPPTPSRIDASTWQDM